MISKIIQKEKERQIEIMQFATRLSGVQHKQSLINLKEYREEELRFIKLAKIETFDGLNSFGIKSFKEEINKIEEDIQELIKMIEAYK